MKKWILLILQAVISVSLLAWIFSKPEFRGQIESTMKTADPYWLVAGLAIAGFLNLVGAVRWGIFLRVVGIRLSTWEVVRISWIGLFFNNFLVGAVGGDAVKVVWLAAKGYPKFPALLSVLMDRMSGIGALVLATLTLVLGKWEWLSRSPVVAGYLLFAVIYVGVVVLLMALSFALAACGAIDRIPPNFPGRRWMVEFDAVYVEFLAKWRQTLCGAGLSVVILVAHFLTFYCSARAFGLDVPVIDFCAIMPTVDIISAMPISLGGFGVREKLFETMLGDLFGTPAALAVSISLAGALMLVLWSLVGAALLPSYRKVTGGLVPE